MKKTLIILCLFFVFTTSSNAQTKAETITWLQQKLQTYIDLDPYFRFSAENLSVEVTECFITIKFTYVLENNGKRIEEPGRYYKIPTEGVVFGDGMRIGMKDKLESIRHHTETGETFFNRTCFIVKLGEENLFERLNKAVTHLATFCPKKQETF